MKRLSGVPSSISGGTGWVWLGCNLEGVGVLLLISQVSKPCRLVLTKEQSMRGKLWGKMNKGP